MRLVDADALKDNCDIKLGNDTIGRRQYVIFHEIDDAPTVDAVQVVRCEDCIHQVHCYKTVAHTRHHGDFVEYWSETIEWCSRGERKGGDDK